MTRNIIIILAILILANTAIAWPLDLKINHAILRSDDILDFNIVLLGSPYNYPTDMLIITKFNDTHERKFSGTEELAIYFASRSNIEGDNIIDTNDLRVDPVASIAPKDLIANGSYNASLGGLPGIVTWWAAVSSGSCEISMVGLTRDNSTEIAVKSDANVWNNEIPDEELISTILSSFNSSLKRIEIHYLA